MDASFRDRLTSWLSDQDQLRNCTYDVASARAAQAAIYDAGFAGITWPREYGGQGLSSEEQRVFEEETQALMLPTETFLIGFGMAGPTILDLGSEEQKQQYIRPILRGDDIWCQMFSEPEAGSDVAGLKTRARRTNAGWVVDGQKIWTSRANFADRGILLARTDPDVPKHAGLTMFVIDMNTPGITVRPLTDMTGGEAFNEIFLDQVEVPANAVLGEVGGGWRAAIQMLKHERMTVATRHRPQQHPASFRSLATVARNKGCEKDERVRARLASLFVAETVGGLFAHRLGEEVAAGRDPGPVGSIGKLAEAWTAQLATEAATEIAGDSIAAWDPPDEDAGALAWAISETPKYRIAGGTDEIQRNIIAERILGLPKDQLSSTGTKG